MNDKKSTVLKTVFIEFDPEQDKRERKMKMEKKKIEKRNNENKNKERKTENRSFGFAEKIRTRRE